MIKRDIAARAIKLVAALALAIAGANANAELDNGVIYLDFTSSSTQLTWIDADGMTVNGTQDLNPFNPCGLDQTDESLLSFGAPLGGVASAKQFGIGVNFVSGNGTSCAGIDKNRNKTEALSITSQVGYVDYVKLQIELKGDAPVAELRFEDSATSAVQVFEIRGGGAVGSGRSPDDFTNPNPIIDCFEGGSDVAPDARDTCVVEIQTFANVLTITPTADGQFTLEGGRSIVGPSEFHLTSATGSFSCGDIVTTTALDQSGLLIAEAACRRTETNLVNCPDNPVCQAVPERFEFNATGEVLTLEYDAGDQCVAVQCQVSFASFLLSQETSVRTADPLVVGVDDPADVQYTQIIPPQIQFATIDDVTPPDVPDDKIYLQTCSDPTLATTDHQLVFHPEVDVQILSAASAAVPPFAAGDIVSNANSSKSAKVVSYREVDGETVLVLFGDSFVAGETVTGPNGSAQILSDERDSTFIQELVRSDALFNPDGAGYLTPDYSDYKPNLLGIQYGCLRSISNDVIGVDTNATSIDLLIHGDIRMFAR